MIDDDATQFSYFRDNELTQLAEVSMAETSEERHMALEEGTLFLGKYKILKILGEGSFSLIYLLEANNASKKLLVAKEFFPKGFVTRNNLNEVVLKTSLTEKEIENYQFMKDIFIGEAQNLVKVSSRTHPNVLNFFALEENVNNTMYLITDYEEGVTLKDYLQQRKEEYKGKLNNEEVIKLLEGLLDGLGHIHNVNIYHQDIKLENILIRHDHTPLLLDFGASVILYDKKRKKYFNATTPRYAAPEQIELAQPPKIDQRSDIYALGVLAYKMITDTFPPKASERLKALDEEHEDPYISLETQKIYGYDMTVLKSIDKALNLLPEDRFQNAKEFSNALYVKNKLNFVFMPKLLLGLLLPIFGLLIYFIWPVSQGTVKLNLKEKSYFLYSDGIKVPISEEKTIVLSEGKHQLTFIKDGFVPFESNVTIKANKIMNVSAELIPLTHLIQLSSNVDNPTYVVNNEQIEGNTFYGKYGEKYIIKIMSVDYSPESVETNYTKLYYKHFRLYQKLKSKNQDVQIEIKKPINLDIGMTEVFINNHKINDNFFIAKSGNKYSIEIVNKYFKPMKIEKTFKELVEKPIQEFTLVQGSGKILINELFPDVKIELYKNNNRLPMTVAYKNKTYIVTAKANKDLYLKFSKQGYITKETSFFSLENNATLVQKYTLSKIGKVVPINTTQNIDSKKHIKKIVKTKTSTKKVKNNEKTKKTKKNKIVKKSLKKINRKKDKKKEIRKNKETKVRKVTKKKKKEVLHRGATWYCVAINYSAGSWSAKKRSRQKAHNSALKKCRSASKQKCYISSCYLWEQ